MSRKHRRTLRAVFTDPVLANIAWRDVEAMFKALGAEVNEAEGSAVEVILDGHRAVFHEPHPQKELLKPGVRAVRMLLVKAGVSPQ